MRKIQNWNDSGKGRFEKRNEKFKGELKIKEK